MKLWTGALAERNFRYLVSARAISYFGTYLAPIAVAFAVLDLTGSASDTGIAFACWTLAQISALMVGGVVSDRLPRRLVMVSSDAANVCIRLAMGVLLLSGHARIWEIFLLQALGGAATAFYSPASSGLAP
jgi:MFS family permease